MNNDFLLKYKEMLINVTESLNGNRSARKVDVLHGIIATHLQIKLGEDYLVETKETTGREVKINGRYIDKKVDITIKNVRSDKIVAGIGVKAPLNTYLKNRNNYFENMLGETANIRCNNIPYFQIMVLPFKIPEWQGSGVSMNLKNYYKFDKAEKFYLYQKLAEDNSLAFYHTPVKTLLMIIDDKFPEYALGKKYSDFLTDTNSQLLSSGYLPEIKTLGFDVNFDKNVIFNDYEQFIDKVTFLIKGFD